MDFETIKNSILDTFKSAAKDFYEASAESRAFVEDRAEDAARLVIRLAQADADEYDAIKHEIRIAKQAGENELAGLALDGEAAAKQKFKVVMGTIFDAAEKFLPVLIGLL